MDCPHLEENINIGDFSVKTETTKEKQCAVCLTSQSPWLCLQCGIISCGRYVKGHAKDHSEENDCHNICMCCETLSVYCYECDEFISNDTQCGTLGKLRDLFSTFVNGSELDSDNLHREDDEGSWKSDSNSKEMQENVRCLRPRSRKRSHCNDSELGCENEPAVKQLMDQSVVIAKPKTKKAVGLRNLGNTCFMNAVLQSLSNIQAFCGYFKQLPSLEDGSVTTRSYQSRSYKDVKQTAMAEELRKVLVNLTQGEGKSAISPESFFLVIVVPRFRGYQQQDAHEFLRYMLDRLHTELLHLLPDATQKDSAYLALGQTQKGRSSIVTSIFGGTLQSEVRCLNCGGESKKHDPFLDLSLDIPDQFLVKTDKNGSSPDCNLLDCLRSFVQVEELGDTEQYLCNTCKSKQRSTKRFWIRRLPNVLCLHLKRFRWYSGFRTKLDTSVAFPVQALDMTQFTLDAQQQDAKLGDNLYDLAAVIVHHGTGAGSGHYTAFAVNDCGWYHFNDSTVRPAPVEHVSQCKAYILFYIRRAFQLPIVKTAS